MILSLFLLSPSLLAGQAGWDTVTFDLTKNDAQAYAANIPDDAFTAGGMKLPVKDAASYSLTSKQSYSGEFNFDVQLEIVDRNDAGTITIDLVLTNDQKQRKVVASMLNYPKPDGQAPAARPGRAAVPEGAAIEHLECRYFKDGKAMSVQNGDAVRSDPHPVGRRGLEWLQLHKIDSRVWFMGRFRGEPYKWEVVAERPFGDFFKGDCEDFQVGLEVKASGGAAGTVLIKTLQISGSNVLPKDGKIRSLFFDFGPVDQQLEDGFCPVSEYSMYTSQKGYGWRIREPEKLFLGDEHVPQLTDAEIAKAGLSSVGTGNWKHSVIRSSYWLQQHDMRLFYSRSHGNDWVEFFKTYLDLKTPLERDFVGMCRPYITSVDYRYEKDVDERRGSIYVDDGLNAEFLVDLPNGRYNVIVGVGYSDTIFSLIEGNTAYSVEIEGKVRKSGLHVGWRPTQNPVRDVVIEDGQMNIRIFIDPRTSMDKYINEDVTSSWMINYVLILPAEQKELMNAWEWKIIKRRSEIIRRVTFVEGQPAVTKNEGNFISLNGKPMYFLKAMGNYHVGTTEHFNYYCLNNLLSTQHNLKNSAHFFKPDWEKLSYSDDYPWDVIDKMNVTYTWGYLTTLHEEGILSFVPRAVSGEGSPTVDARGRQNRYDVQPPLNSALGKEIQKEAYTMLANQLASHPTNAGHFVYEELWHPDENGYDEQSLIQYQEWLKRKYQTIDALNADWGRKYQSWDEIVQPVQKEQDGWWQFTPEFVNFRTFRGWAQREMVRNACDLIREKEPDHFSWAAKGDAGTQSWYTGEFLDMFGWYTPYVAGSVARHFGKAAVVGGYLFNCEFAYLDGRLQFDHAAGPRVYRGKGETEGIYNHLISSVFKGAKGFYNEWYDDGMCHVFHYTDAIKSAAARNGIKHWSGQLAFFDEEGFQGPPVKLERSPLYACRANQMLYRLSQLWLPAKPLEPKVLIPTTESSYFLDYFGKPGTDFEGECMRILRSANVPVDFVRLSAVKDLSKYEAVIICDTAQAISKADAKRLKDYVAKGGKLLMVNAGGFVDEARPRRYSDKGQDVYPLEEFAEMGGYRLMANTHYHMPINGVKVSFAKNDFGPEFADGQSLGEWNIRCYYKPSAGSSVFIKGKMAKTDEEIALGIINANKNVAVMNFSGQGEAARQLTRCVRRLLENWKVDGRVTMGGIDDAWDMYAGAMQGDGYTLAAVCNMSKEARKTNLKLSFLPAGQYAVMDVTGDTPDLQRKADGGLALKNDPAARVLKINMQASAQQLSESGIPAEIAPGQARVFMIRPMESKVWVSIYKPWLKAFANRPVKIAYGTAAADKTGAEAIQAALAKAGFKVDTVPCDQIKRIKAHHDVNIIPDMRHDSQARDRAKPYLVDTFDNEPLETTAGLIVVGNEDSNELLRHLGKDGTFAYDKALEKINAQYPGAGRGIIGVVECINSATYDMRSQSRDAITVGGSDAEGTAQAVAEMVKLIGQYCKVEAPRPPASNPATAAALAD